MTDYSFRADITVKEWEEMKARIEKLEKGKAEPETKPEQWKPKPLYFNFESIVPHPQAQWMEEKLTRYAKQLQWLYTNYPEQNGEWGEDTQWFLYYSKDYEGWCCAVEWKAPNLNLIYMSEKVAKHLAVDLNSGKVRFHD